MVKSHVKLGAVLVGWVISYFTLFVILAGSVGLALYGGLDITKLVGGDYEFQGFYLNFAIFMSVFTAFFIGGYVAGRMAAIAGSTNGFLVVMTNILMIFFAGTFVTIIGNSLDIDVMGPIGEITKSYTPMFIVSGLFALAGGIFGGRLGEGYISRLDRTLAKRAQKAQSTKKPATTSPKPKPATTGKMPAAEAADKQGKELSQPRQAS